MGAVATLRQIPSPSTVSSLKAFARRLLAEGCYRSGLTRSAHRGKVPILTYHRVFPDGEVLPWIQAGMYVTRSVFERQMAFLRQNYEILSFPDLLTAWEENRLDARERYCAVTFDDGWHDTYLHAYPILRRHRVPATVFLPTSFIGTNRWFWTDQVAYLLSHSDLSKLKEADRSELFGPFAGRDGLETDDFFQTADHQRQIGGIERLIKVFKNFPVERIHPWIDSLIDRLGQKLPRERMFLNWKEIDEMSRLGISFGSHTCSHRILTTLSLEEAQTEMEESRRVLEGKRLGFLPVFCYPDGRSNEAVRELVRKSGYTAAVGGRFGLEDYRPEDRFWIRRIGIHQDISRVTPLFAYRLMG
jgi:peptidoglycan/xylan/chitin deacetylase (PgdA/CDA1 family)